MKKNILVIYNPYAGKNGAAEMLSDIVHNLRKENCRVTVYPIMTGFGCEDIIIAEKDNFDYVMCCGGDGTLNHTINGLMQLEKKPYLVYLPTGSTNDFAVSLGISKNAEITCHAVNSSAPFYYDIGKFNHRYFNYIAAFGAFTDVSYSTPQTQKNVLGHAAYIIEGIKRLPIGKYHTLTATANGNTYSGDYIYGSVSNSTSVGGMSIAVKDEILMNDGLFEVILIRAPKTVADTQSLLGALMTKDFDNPFIEYFKTDSIHFKFSKETPWTLDGEFGGDIKECDINVEPKAIGILK